MQIGSSKMFLLLALIMSGIQCDQDLTDYELREEIERLSKDLSKVVSTVATESSKAELFAEEFNTILESAYPPIGFVYTRYPGQHLPSELWPAAQWSDISNSYAGLFFRAEGRNSAHFGKKQDYDYLRMYIVYYEQKAYFEDELAWFNWSKVHNAFVSTGGRDGVYSGIHYSFTGDKEVAPYNTAVEMFRRTA